MQHYRPSDSKSMPEELMTSWTLVFNGSSNKANLPSARIDGLAKPLLIANPYEDLDMVIPTDGAYCKDTFTLVSRKKMVMHNNPGNLSKEFKALSAIEASTPTSVKRGAKHVTFMQTSSSRYFTLGLTATQSGSVSNKDIMAQHRDVIQKLVSRVEHLVVEHVDSEHICGLNAVRNSNPWLNLSANKHSLFASLAAGRNVYLNAHHNEDFWLSVVIVIGLLPNKKLALDDGILAFMCFPRKGLCIALCVGDIIVFNPTKWHCISSCTNNLDKFFCLSFYNKSAVVGKNDNSIPLTRLQKHLLSREAL